MGSGGPFASRGVRQGERSLTPVVLPNTAAQLQNASPAEVAVVCPLRPDDVAFLAPRGLQQNTARRVLPVVKRCRAEALLGCHSGLGLATGSCFSTCPTKLNQRSWPGRGTELCCIALESKPSKHGFD